MKNRCASRWASTASWRRATWTAIWSRTKSKRLTRTERGPTRAQRPLAGALLRQRERALAGVQALQQRQVVARLLAAGIQTRGLAEVRLSLARAAHAQGNHAAHEADL